MQFTADYEKNRSDVSSALCVSESFDIIERRLHIQNNEISFYYIDGFVKDSEMQRVMQRLDICFTENSE